ncbi:hypothetical protein N9B31_05380 [Mariniblastus sp.]|nr:hypothetical protein [Mariniblastus sp.]MDA7923054.1 hypothetical protein [bacterium]MDA7903076.1 hypothetical protein [Mariniblastus sp.]MDB4368826.1 hypothetical protein [bacterium]MDB4386469.1 hypothetical protein [bacterium]
MEFSILLLLINAIATLYMTGLIWMVQIVHYPLFSEVGLEQFPQYAQKHQFLTSIVVGPPMLTEALSAILLAWFLPPGTSLPMVIAGILLVISIWASTAVIQVPCHEKLEEGFTATIHRRLVLTNWFRTVAWTARGVLVAWMLTLVINAITVT